MATAVSDRAALDGLAQSLLSLVSEKATPSQWQQWLRVPLEHAAASGNKDLVNSLIRAGADRRPGWRGCYGRTLLGAAAEGGDPDVVSTFIHAGAEAELDTVSGPERWSPLHRASAGGHETAATMLLVAGANASIVDIDSCSPLHLAVRANGSRLVGELLIGGASPNARDNRGESPLHVAARHAEAGTISNLLLRGADMNMLNRTMATPLHVATQRGRVETVKTLLEAGANMSLRTVHPNCYSALDVAAIRGQIEIVRMLVEHGADVNAIGPTHKTTLSLATMHNDSRETIEVLIQVGANVRAHRAGWTLLHSAAKQGHCNAMLGLLQHGAALEAPWDTSGMRPLHVACSFLQVDAADLLLRWGADQTAVDNNGVSAEGAIGRLAEQSDRAADMERLRRLLTRAEEDRTWRRRGMFVMARTLPDHVGLGVKGDDSDSDAVPPPAIRSRQDAGGDQGQGNAGGSRGKNADGDNGRRVESAEGGAAGVVEASDEFSGLGAWVIGLGQDDVFQRIMRFV